MSLPDTKANYEEASNETPMKSIVRLCQEGDLFYQKIAMVIKSYSLKKVCFEMANHFQHLSNRINKERNIDINSNGNTSPSQFKIEPFYDTDLQSFTSLNTEQLIVKLSSIESQNLSSLKESIRFIDDVKAKNLLSDVAAHLQTTLDKLNTLAESALKNDYKKQ